MVQGGCENQVGTFHRNGHYLGPWKEHGTFSPVCWALAALFPRNSSFPASLYQHGKAHHPILDFKASRMSLLTTVHAGDTAHTAVPLWIKPKICPPGPLFPYTAPILHSHVEACSPAPLASPVSTEAKSSLWENPSWDPDSSSFHQLPTQPGSKLSSAKLPPPHQTRSGLTLQSSGHQLPQKFHRSLQSRMENSPMCTSCVT